MPQAGAAIIAAEEALAAAHLTLDRATLDRLLHPDYIIVQPSGEIENKAQTSLPSPPATAIGSWRRATR